ncbi:D-amino-acid transaminase [Methylocystis parvus]|uniref:Probable branched-chain-amino-acid aminotransferase n=1 Tax=Methylocystis parvus TaxID=134 RepID=A0A6B8M7X9_9HYPH|nr:D-amino-acid transaminase [Methylocystis parvus]QGM98658.1 D-amino-acid transaminase [Methylocystis parvus]WBK00994.1 D-amino-acid transaminase [Methylocystis parvus OBBP]
MSDIAYVNGAYTPLEDAKISILDRGFLFADGVYEVAAVIDGRLVDNAAHLARLERSLKELRLECPASMQEIVEIEKTLVARNGIAEGMVYLQITRGAAERDFAFPKGVKPTLIAFTQEKNILSSLYAEKGIRIVTVPDQRWARRDIKSVALLAQVLAKQAASEAGCQEAWMVGPDGYITEGSSSTAFIITKAGAIVTRPNSEAILPGCTRLSVLALAAEHGLDVAERAFTAEEAYEAAEAFLTSASNLVLPIVSIDGRAIGDGKPGPHATRLRALYLDFARATACSS